ncbi:hypothetical protein BHE74_00046287 [Ensete ventricosum]|nr:hypothetical protein BHE74_00046287 [Ensete ventricosum]RZR85904.1 hypothetical protein BHM03_00012966 [Ensete ventricosum]
MRRHLVLPLEDEARPHPPVRGDETSPRCLVPAREDEASPCSRARRCMVLLGSGRSAYQYPVEPIRTAHIGRYRSKRRTLHRTM